MSETKSTILLKNIGFDVKFFEKLESGRSAFIIKKEKMRKVGSENAVVKVEGDGIFIRRNREEEDIEIYKEAESSHGLFDEEEEIVNTDKERSTIRGAMYIDRESDFYNEIEDEPDKASSHLEKNLSLFQNCSQAQISQLNQLFSQMNSSNEERVLVKAYKSKLKSKFYEVYEKNSQQLKEKIKYKIFHKCNYPSCGRTFASSGWLKSHFKEHLDDLEKNKFNILFDQFIEKYKDLCFHESN